jgi:7-carboxy-7-deazaguanine synthase
MPRLPAFPRETDVLLVNETFLSVQGESTHAGRPCFFIRLAGCHLRCSYCDTEYAFHEGREQTVDEAVAKAREAGVKLVEITGGEPLLQKPVYTLMGRLLAEGFEVMLETSGSIDASRVPVAVRRIFDVKTPGSGEADANRWENFANEALHEGDEIKFVIGSREDYEWAREAVRTRLARVTLPILFSPVWDAVKPADLAAWILEDKLPVRFQLQMHKVVWGDKRGV